MSKYKPATFQPTVRPDWAGVLSYMNDKEKSLILEAILKFPSIEIESPFYNQTIKPDLTLQYENFKQVCLAKQRGVNNRWKMQKEQESAEKTEKTSNKQGIDIYTTSTRKDIDAEGEGEGEGKEKEESKKRGAGGKEKLSLSKGIDLSFAGDSALIEPFKRFLDYRREIKKPFKSMMSVKSAFKKLDELSLGSFPIADAVVEQSISNGWQGLFPLKDERKEFKKSSEPCDYNALLNLDLTGGLSQNNIKTGEF